jgi:hypothetical protein
VSLPPFVLVHRPGAGRKVDDPAAARWLADVARQSPSLASALGALPPPLRASLLRSALDQVGATAAEAVPALERAAYELHRQKRVETVGLWDVGARVGRLPDVIAALNAAQPVFAFFQARAAAPTGLVSATEWLAEWFWRSHRRRLTPTERRELAQNVIADDFLPRVDRVRRDLGLHCLAAITPHMIAGWDDAVKKAEASWNYFNWWDASGRNLLVSTHGVHEYARRAERPFEAAVASIAVSALLVVGNPKLDYHPEDRGCLFDRNDDRDSIVAGLRAMRIEDDCLELIAPRYRGAAEALAGALRSYRREE